MMAGWFAAAAVFVVASPWLLDLRRRPRRLEDAAPSAAPPDGQPSVRSVRAVRDRVRRRLRTRPTRRPPDGWIDALDRLARSTATGSSFGQAIATEGARADSPPSLRELARLRASGLSVADALAQLGPTTDPDGRLALAVLGVVARAGGPPDEPLDRAAAVLRERRALERERAVGAAQSRLSAQVLSVLPAAVAGWSIATDPRLGHVLLGTPIGAACLAIGGGLDLVGWRWMRRIVSRT